MLSKLKLTPGVWYWKDDTNTLKFVSSNPEAEENLKEGINIVFQELRVKTLKSIFQDDGSATLPERMLYDEEEKLYRLSKWVQHEYVTLEDVKYAALLLKGANESHYMLSFSTVMRTVTFLENKEMDDVLAKLTVARIHLAKAYCKLILGQGMAQQYHVPSRKRKTSLQKDRSFSEGFFNFCSHVAWLVFRRKHCQVIREEIGRLFCSDMFNPALRDKNSVDLQKPGDRTADANTVRLPYLRKAHAKRPSINSMVHQRSPLLNTLLPLLKGSAQYLSQNHCWGRQPQPFTSDDLLDFSELFTTKVGIIGAHCSELKSLMSMPVGTMEEEEEEEEQGRMSGLSNLTRDLSLPLLRRSPQNRLSNQSTVLSGAVAEGGCN